MNRSTNPAARYRNSRRAAGFSMIELALSIGVLGFCLLAVVGLLPTGLETQRLGQDQSRAASALNMTLSAVESVRFTGRDTGNAAWSFPSYFSDANGSPTVTVGQTAWNYTFFVSDGGLVIPSSDTTTTRRQTLYVKVYPPQVEGQPVQIYAAVAWPYKPTDDTGTTADQMAGRQGFVDIFVAYTPKYSF